MVQIWRSFDYAVPMFVAAVLLVTLIAAGVAFRRRRSGVEAPARADVGRLALDGLLVLWLVGLALVTLAPGRVPVPRGSVELVPLRGIVRLLTDSVWWQVPAAQIGGNIALFVPGGVLLAWRRHWGVGRTVLAGGAVSVVIETAQYVFALGVASIDDVLLACLGTLIGAVATRLVMAWPRRPRPLDRMPVQSSEHAGTDH